MHVAKCLKMPPRDVFPFIVSSDTKDSNYYHGGKIDTNDKMLLCPICLETFAYDISQYEIHLRHMHTAEEAYSLGLYIG